MDRRLARPRTERHGQAYTEYVVILAVLFGVGFGVASIFAGFEELREMFFGYYASLANYLNLPCF